MFPNDYILRQIELLGRGLREMVYHDQEDLSEEVFSGQGVFSGKNYLRHLLRRLVSEGRIGEAEDALFAHLEREPDAAHLEIALEFYDELAALDDGTLRQGDFSREEIAEGLRDVKALWTSRQPPAKIEEKKQNI